ncbi:MAG: hydrogenase maturation protease [Planctomycetota bacterium]
MTKQLAVVGVGNILLKDEGIGVVLANTLEKECFLADKIEYFDGGTAFFSLLPAIEDFSNIILLDATEGGAEPGTVFFFNADEIESSNKVKYSLHDMGIHDELKLSALSTGMKSSVKIIGIQPFEIAVGTELSPGMLNSFDKILEKVKKVLREEVKT